MSSSSKAGHSMTEDLGHLFLETLMLFENRVGMNTTHKCSASLAGAVCFEHQRMRSLWAINSYCYRRSKKTPFPAQVPGGEAAPQSVANTPVSLFPLTHQCMTA